MNRLRNGSIAVGAPGSAARIAAEATDNALEPERVILIAAGHKKNCDKVFYSLSPDMACSCGAEKNNE